MEKFNDDLGDLSQFKILNFDDVKKGFLGTDPFEGVRTNKTFQEISNEIALTTPFGKHSEFYRELREIIKGQIPIL
ncbi:hypothetical protein NAL32_15645 [Chryseobacterium sp. Ch-15]|uniref:Uncharacterized protein n=1 Tax=Chryseobacterium muglaense TaxID=2893752 RepID=A0A9Q3UVP4_9FLAO|nr:hypothetical protein [Chryseobacterium muglaense]MBD3906019.1 hypothetical protein [Chryseobacterium muglaense]MCC9035247.1 hypothetical protein [Chryseobacterium muglaense]MCM2555818.1 hypothetical protein [Chryseobacterium muglaense]